jgi:transcriptional regulator with XRE-family HTH domain
MPVLEPEIFTEADFMTPMQVRLAKEALGLTLIQLAGLCDVSPSSAQRVAAGEQVKPYIVRRMRRALEAAGIEFIGDTGVNLRGPMK